jgi:uncharacterized membrane protein
MSFGAPTAEPLLFEAVILPHRSLTARGRAWLIGLICLLGSLTAFRFWLIGAWPVIAFSAVEIGIAIPLLRVNARQARASELVLLNQATLRIVRTTAGGQREERVFSSTWLNVVLEERPGRVPGLLLVSRGIREEIGTMLGEAERRDLARALSEAVYFARNPRFNNPQLQNRELLDD